MRFDSAKRAVNIADYIGGDPAKQAVFDNFHQQLSERLKPFDKEQYGPSLARHAERVVAVALLTAPERHETEEANVAIQHAYNHLLAERSKYLSAQRERFRNEPRLCKMAKNHLGELGCPEVWNLVASSSSSRQIDSA